MARTDIHHEEKKNEIAKKLWSIFIRYGYENTTLALIIRELNISKGAFYHYFPSKEACADAAVDLFADNCIKQIAKSIEKNQPADEKLRQLILYSASLSAENATEYDKINSSSNTIFHQKLMATLVKKFAPIYASVIEQGVKEEIFKSNYPLETAEMLLTLSNFFFDTEIFHWESSEMKNKLLAFQELFTLTLQAKSQTFQFLQNMIMGESL